MPKEFLYFIGGVLIILLPIALVLAVKKLDLFEQHPDEKLPYSRTAEKTHYLHRFNATKPDANALPAALLLFHGGGWRYGSPQQFYPQCAYFAERGITCFAAEYRLGPPNTPDISGAISDAAAAFDYLRKNAAALKIDPDRIFVGGGSAGGHLAAALGAGLHGRDRPRPFALALYNPVLDLSPCTPSHHLTSSNWLDVSPLHNIDGEFPRTVILSGQEDREVTPSMVKGFCDAVNAVGGQCEVQLYAGQGHGFFNPREGGNPWLQKTNERIEAFIEASGP